MNSDKLQKIIQENKTEFNLLISDKIFKIDEIEIFENENPVTKPTTRGGVYFSDIKEMKVKVTLSDTSITKHISKAMLGPNKTAQSKRAASNGFCPPCLTSDPPIKTTLERRKYNPISVSYTHLTLPTILRV